MDNLYHRVRWLIGAGTEDAASNSDKRPVRIINALALLTAFLVLLIGSYFSALTRSAWLFAGVLLEALAFIGVIILNSFKRYFLASAATLVIHCFFALYFCILLGRAMPVEGITSFLLTFLIGTSFLVYKQAYIRRATVMAIIVIMTLVFLDHRYLFIHPISLTPEMTDIIHLGCWAGIAIMMAVVTMFIIRQNDAAKRENDELLDKLKAVDVAKTRYIRENNHELRTPLNAMGVVAQRLNVLMQERPELHIIKDELDILNTSAQTAIEIINEKLDYAKIEAGMFDEVKPVSFRLGDLLKDCLTVSNNIAKAKSVQVKLDVSSMLPKVIVTDKLLLKKILNNLLSNAIKFSLNQMPVKVAVLQQGDMLYLSVTNTGRISVTHSRKIFQPYYAESNYQLPGTGLGLFTSKTFVEQLHGSIGYYTTETTTTFHVKIPLVEGREKDVPATSSTIARIDLTGYVVLIVEDDPMTLRLLKRQLSDTGADVRTAERAEDALPALNGLIPQLICCDDGLPLMQGRDFIRMLRNMPTFTDIPIIVMTGNAFDDQVDDILKAGANEVLKKPVAMADLYNLIRKHLFHIPTA